jgi:predicted outer membrane repeat protein
MTITGTLFENNTCDSNGGAIFAKTTTVSIESSVLINNSDANGVAIYGYKTEQANPAVTLNDNWWGSNDSPKDLVGGNSYNPTLSRWAILTITNETPIVAGETVKLIVSINNYTTGTENGTMANPIKVKRGMTLSLNNNEIPLTLEDGVATYDYTVPADAKYIATTVDGETTILYVVSSQVTIEVADIDAKKYEKVHVEINVASDDTVNAGQVQLYVNGAKLIATIDVVDGKAIGDVVISENDGSYNLTAKYVNGAPLFDDNEKNATLTVSGTVELTNTTFFNFFDNDGILRDEIAEEELVFHGDFGGLGVDIITIPRSISIKGDDTTLYDMALSIQSGNSKVEDMKLIADGADFVLNGGAAILAFGENIELNNVTVNFTTPSNSDAHAVYASYANNFKLIDSTIIFDSLMQVQSNMQYTLPIQIILMWLETQSMQACLQDLWTGIRQNLTWAV